jgi:transcriptional regulator GlxA family with amidase domain
MILPILATSALGLASSLPATGGDEPKNVAILVYEGVELLDFAGPGEVFSAADGPAGHAFRVYTVAKTRAPVKSQGFVEIVPQYSIANAPAADLVVVPGGHVPDDDVELQRFVADRVRAGGSVMSVCNGALLLARAGLLDGREVTSHHGTLAHLALVAPTAKVLTNRRFVDHGSVMTCAGVSAGIDGALHVVERMLGAEEAKNVARYMEYDWRPAEIAELHAQPGKTPEESPAVQLARASRERGLERALSDYRALASPPSETDLNASGYSLLRAGRKEEAIALFHLVDRAFPASANASDSLSEALERAGDKTGALASAEEALRRLGADAAMKPERAQLLRNAAASRLVRLGKGDRSALRYVCPPCGSDCDDVRYVEATRCPGCPMELEASPEGTLEAAAKK